MGAEAGNTGRKVLGLHVAGRTIKGETMTNSIFRKLFLTNKDPKPPKAICVVNRSKDFDRLVKVLYKSWHEHNIIPLEIHAMQDGWNRKYKHGLWVNTLKLEKWAELFQQDTIFLDADLLCTGDMAEPFKMINHLGYTENRARGRILNAGVFMRSTPTTHRCFWQNG